jgi:parallel beta-helix repeat protein
MLRRILLTQTRQTLYDYVVSVSGGVYTARNRNGIVVSSSATLLTVMDAIKAANKHIHFGAGTFDFGVDHVTFNGLDNLTISGSGMDITIIQNSNDTANDTEPLSYTDCNYAIVKDLTISAGGLARASSDALDFDHTSYGRVERVKVTLSRGRGIVYDGKDTGSAADYNVIQDCIVTGCPQSGIELLAAQNCQILNCTSTGNQRYGINLAKASSTAGQPNKKASNNIITGGVYSSNVQHGINITSSDGNVISGTTVQNNGSGGTTFDGIRIQTTDSITADNNTIDSNLANDTQGTKTQRYGINIGPALVAQANNNIVTNNNLQFNKTAGLNDIGTATTKTNNLT